MLIGIALFRLHVQGEEYVCEGTVDKVHRCGTVSVRKVTVNLASVAHC